MTSSADSLSGLAAMKTSTSQAARYEPANQWARFLWLPLFLSLALLVLPQFAFIWMSFHTDLGMGQLSEQLSLDNYVKIFTDAFYLRSIVETTALAAGATSISLLLAFPTAYMLARLGTWMASFLLSIILGASFITIVIKLLGLNIILGPSGLVNQIVMGLHIVSTPLELLNNRIGVLIGLVQYTLPILILLLFGVAQTIPVQLEEASELHGATRLATFMQVILPLAKQGLVSGGLISFNMCMGAFTSPLVLGGGRILTLPVLIQEKMILEIEYGMAAALSIVLLVFVFTLNVVVGSYVLKVMGRRPVRAK